MKNILFIFLIGLVIGCTNNDDFIDCDYVENCPLFYGTIFVAPETLTGSDPTFFESISRKEDANREMYDRRVDGWINIKPYLFESIDDMKPWPKATDQKELMIRSDSILTIADPTKEVIGKYLELTK